MSLTHRPSNHLLQALPAAEFDALCPHLKTVELVKETVLVVAHWPHCHFRPIFLAYRMSEGSTV
jgi:hypothetical protein